LLARTNSVSCGKSVITNTLPDGGERDEAVVHRVKVRPALVGRERGRAARDRQAGQEGHDEYQIDLGGLRALAAQRPLRLSDHHGGELVQLLADALEHDQAQRYAHHRVEHGEQLARLRVRRRVAVTCARKQLTVNVPVRSARTGAFA